MQEVFTISTIIFYNILSSFKKPLAFSKKVWYNIKVVKRWPIGQAVKTLASHAGNSGSIPGWVTKKRRKHIVLPSFLLIC